MKTLLRLCLMICLCLSTQAPAFARVPADCGHSTPPVVSTDEGCCDGRMPANPHAACDAAACAVYCASLVSTAPAAGLDSDARVSEQVPAPGFHARIAPVYRHERPPRGAVSIL